jgi:hypothetical protein
MSMPRMSPKSVAVDPNARCLRIYPTEETKKSVGMLKTVGLKLSKDQAIHLARILLAVTQDWDEVDVTAYRLKRRKSDGTYQLTLTTHLPDRD